MAASRHYVAFILGPHAAHYVVRTISEGKALLPVGRWSLDEGVPLVKTHRALRLRVWRHFRSPEGVLMGIMFGLDDPRAGYDGYLEEWRGKPPGYYGDLEKLGLSVRTMSALTCSGITTAEALRAMMPAEVAKVKNLGRKGLQEIENALKGKVAL